VPPTCAFLLEKHETWLISDMSDATAAGATAKCDDDSHFVSCQNSFAFTRRARARKHTGRLFCLPKGRFGHKLPYYIEL